MFAGVAMTNLPGILVLGLARAQLIHIFFFRLNLLITLLGLLHGLVFLPVVLSYLGECQPPTGAAGTPGGASGTARGHMSHPRPPGQPAESTVPPGR